MKIHILQSPFANAARRQGVPVPYDITVEGKDLKVSFKTAEHADAFAQKLADFFNAKPAKGKPP